MSRIQILMLLGALLLAEMAHAEPVEPVEQAAQAKCQVAEVKGAPVEPPPEDIAPPCNAEASRGQWSWEPTCKPAPKG